MEEVALNWHRFLAEGENSKYPCRMVALPRAFDNMALTWRQSSAGTLSGLYRVWPYCRLGVLVNLSSTHKPLRSHYHCRWAGTPESKREHAPNCLLLKQNKMLFKGNQLELLSIHKYFGKWLVHFNYSAHTDNNIFCKHWLLWGSCKVAQILFWHSHSFLWKTRYHLCNGHKREWGQGEDQRVEWTSLDQRRFASFSTKFTIKSNLILNVWCCSLA